jgi:hypothetical protein
MKRFKAIFIKKAAIATMKQEPLQILEQEYITDQDGITLITPSGYALVSITEYLPLVNQCKNEKVIN